MDLPLEMLFEMEPLSITEPYVDKKVPRKRYELLCCDLLTWGKGGQGVVLIQ